MKQNKPVIYLGSGIIGAIVYAVLGLLGYNAEAEGVVQAGGFEFDPVVFRNIISVLIPILIPLINRRWPGVGDIIQKILGFLIPKEDGEPEVVSDDGEHESYCNLCKVIERDGKNGDTAAAKLGLALYCHKVLNSSDEPKATPDEVAE